MAAMLIISFIFMILLIILTRYAELSVSSRGRLFIKINLTLISLELSNFGAKRKKKKHTSLTASFSSLDYLLRHGELCVRDVSVSGLAPMPLRSTASAFISLIFAYSDSVADKISLPRETGVCDEPFTFDFSVRARLFVFISAFIIYKIKGRGRVWNVG